MSEHVTTVYVWTQHCKDTMKQGFVDEFSSNVKKPLFHTFILLKQQTFFIVFPLENDRFL